MIKQGKMVQYAYNTGDLAPEERLAVERLLGRALQNDEAIELVVHKRDVPRQEPVPERRKAAAARIRQLAVGKSLGGVTVRQLIEEGRRF